MHTEELCLTLRQQSLLNLITNTIRNSPYGQPDGSPLRNVLQTIVNTVGQMLEVDICILRPFQEAIALDECFIYQKSGAELSTSVSTFPEVLELTVWETRDVEVINDVATDERFADDTPESQQLLQTYQQADICSTLVVPLILQQDLMAVLALHRRGQPHTWEDDEIQLTVMVADQAALAISQARAYEQVRALAQRESLINTITTAIRSSLDPQKIFTAITKQLGQVLEVDGCALSLWTKEDEFVQCVGLYDRYKYKSLETSGEQKTRNETGNLPQSVVPISKNPVLQQLLQTSKTVVLEDMETHPEMNKFDLPLRSPARALLIVPLIVDGEIIGSISLRQTNRSRHWTQSEIELVQAVASQAAIAVQQSRLYEKVKQLNNYLTESVLKRFLPAAIVNKVAAGELTLDLSPEPRLVTILFSDMVGFTPLSNKLGPRRVAELLNEYLEAMTRAVFENGGTVDKFIGDAVLALFGAPEELPPNEQVRRAIAVAKAMHRYLKQLNQRWQAKGIVGGNGPPPVQFRCGIHQGNAVVGMFGGGQRSDYTAIGPAVNIAARLQKAADPNNILVSDAVAFYLEDREISRAKTLKLKGIEEDVMTFSVAINP
ncbi:MAG: GAF domain-containing protein [Xenococcaceae cyanobacterium]